MDGFLGQPMQMIPQEQRQPFDENAFNQQFMAAAMQGMGQDPLDRLSTAAAMNQQKRYNANRASWDDLLQSGGELPRDPSMYDSQTGEFVPAAQRYAQSAKLQADDGSFYETKFTPAGMIGQGTGQQMPWDADPQWLDNVKRGYQQYGPGFLGGVF